MNALLLSEDDCNMVLCETDRYVAVLIEVLGVMHYEIVDRMHHHEAILTGETAKAFTLHTEHWRANTPMEDEVNAVLESYCILGRIPIRIH